LVPIKSGPTKNNMPERETNNFKKLASRTLMISMLATSGAILVPRLQNLYGNSIDSLNERHPYNLRISPNGENIAFVDHENLKVIDNSGKEKTLFTAIKGAWIGSPNWLPNGKTIMLAEHYHNKYSIMIRRIDRN
jgi:hypothetical protein